MVAVCITPSLCPFVIQLYVICFVLLSWIVLAMENHSSKVLWDCLFLAIDFDCNCCIFVDLSDQFYIRKFEIYIFIFIIASVLKVSKVFSKSIKPITYVYFEFVRLFQKLYYFMYVIYGAAPSLETCLFIYFDRYGLFTSLSI